MVDHAGYNINRALARGRAIDAHRPYTYMRIICIFLSCSLSLSLSLSLSPARVDRNSERPGFLLARGRKPRARAHGVQQLIMADAHYMAYRVHLG